MPVKSVGILLYRFAPAGLEVLLVHPGGPFWTKKDLGAWSIPKGLLEETEAEEAGARREFAEETGFPAIGPLIPLGALRQPGNKIVVVFGLEGDLDAAAIRSNSFTLEWPPRSGRKQDFPEVDRAAWFGIDLARQKLLPGQAPFLDALLDHPALAPRAAGR